MKRWLFFLMLTLFAAGARAGHESHGSDNNVESLAWFLGEGREIHYCLESSTKFRKAVAPESELRGAIEETFAQWIEYIKVRKIDTHFFPRDLWSQLTYARKLTWTGKVCRGDEDLTFYFGVDNALTRTARERFDDPMGLTYIPQFDKTSSWQKGFVWIPDPHTISGMVKGKRVFLDWDYESDVMNVLLHEWGHIFGNGHIQGTVMDSSLKQILLAGEAPGGKRREPTIDDSKELYILQDVREDYFVGKLAYDDAANQRLFQELSGRPAEGEITAQVHLVAPLVDGEPAKSTFQVSDRKGGVAFPMVMAFNSPTLFFGEEIFRRRLPSGEVYSNRHSALALRGILYVPKDGVTQTFSIAIEANTSPGEPAGGSSARERSHTWPVTGYLIGVQKDLTRAIFFIGHRATPPDGYRLIPFWEEKEAAGSARRPSP